MSAITLIRRAGPPPPGRALRAAAAGALTAASSIGLMATSAWLITRASQRPPVFALSIAIGAVQAFALGRGLSRYVERLEVHGWALDALARLRVWLFDAVEPLVPGGLREGGRGAVLSGLVGEVDAVSESLATRGLAAIDVLATIVCGALLATAVAPAAGVVLLVGALAMVVTSAALTGLGSRHAEHPAELRAQLAAQVIDAVQSARELAVYGRQDLVREQLERVRVRSTRAATRRALSAGLARAILLLAAAAVLVAVIEEGTAAHAAGRLDGVMLAVLTFVTLVVIEQAAALPGPLVAAAEGDGAAVRLMALAAGRPPVAEAALDRAPAEGRVPAALERVAANHVLSDVSLRLDPGQRVAIKGASGAGKTSALYTLLHFLDPAAGAATLGGVDVREMTRSGIARHLGWLSEETHVFSASLRDNVRIGRRDATDSECVETLQRVGLGALMESLPNGLDTLLGTGGRQLSAGEAQRLGMARALISKADILLLDEPTAHLDPASSRHVLDELMGATGERSVLVVTHEPDIEHRVDRVLTLEAGRLRS